GAGPAQEKFFVAIEWHQAQTKKMSMNRKIGIALAASKGRSAKESFMDWITNIWNHPKTSAAGLLIAVVSIAGVLSQQGITLGKAGTGTVVTLAAALAAALLGLLAKDPKAGSEGAGEQGSTAKLGAWMLIALILSATLPATGCTASASELQSDATALASALNNLAVVIQPSDATAASNLRTA